MRIGHDLVRGSAWTYRNRWRVLAWAAPALCLLFAGYLVFLYAIVTERFEGRRWRIPSKIYSDSFVIFPGQQVEGTGLPERLRRLGYRPISKDPSRPGEYRRGSDALTVYLHDFAYPESSLTGFPVRLVLNEGEITGIVRLPSGQPLPFVELEPELIAAIYNDAWEARELVRLVEVPPPLIEAILSAEDSRFYLHPGVDLRSTARAFWANLKAGGIVQGGSTLTQQLVKNFYLSHERTVRRKAVEILMAVLLDGRYTKDEILEAYLNEIYFGQNGTMGIFGVGEASRHYFDKRPGDLTLGEAALLAGMIKSPNFISPFEDPARAAARRGEILRRMEASGKIGAEEAHAAREESLPTLPPARPERIAPHFIDLVRLELREDYSAEALASEGMRVFTTLDLMEQRLAEETVRAGLARLEAAYPNLRREDPADRLEACLIAIEPRTGYITAMVGGRDYAVSQFNRTTLARRQPGSLFKPFVYAAALIRGQTAQGPAYTPATLIEDSPIELVANKAVWSPQNYDKVYHGTVTLRTALEKSLNVATVRLAAEVGLDGVVATAREMGIKSPLKKVPSLALGTSEVTPIEIATAYATMANGGIRVAPMAIKGVVSSDGRVLERRRLERTPVLTPPQAYILTNLLEGVVDRGTAQGVRRLGLTRPVAGKTGTTSDYKDAWFAGYTPERLGLVWVGFDAVPASGTQDASDPSRPGLGLELTGAQAALPIWTDFMKRATDGTPERAFAPPPGVVFEAINPGSGLIASRECPEEIREAFVEGTEPKLRCGQEMGVAKRFLDWIKSLF